MKSLTFNGIRKDWLYLLEGRQKAPFAPITRNLLKIPGRPGALLQSSEIEPLVIYQPIGFVVKNDIDALTKKDELASWLVTMEPVALEFDDEPGRIYYAVVQNTLSDYEKFVRQRRGIIEFLVLDGFGYGLEKEITFTNVSYFEVDGTVETEPVIEVTLKDDTEYVSVSNGTEYNMVGYPAKEDETPVEPETLIYRTSGQTLVGWTQSAEPSLEGYPNTGTLKSGEYFWTDDYGTYAPNPAVWHGPAMKTSLPQALQDFRFDVGLRALTTGHNQAGSVEVALLDASGRYVARISATKHYPGTPTVYGRVRAGTQANGYDVIREDWAHYNNLQAIFRVIRKGNYWEAQIHAMNYGWSKIVHKWTDYEGIASAPVTQVQVRLFQRGQYPVIDQFVDDIEISKINNMSDGQVPIIAKAGDIVVFDHQNDNITINEESAIDKKAFLGNYFKLKPGYNMITIGPQSAVESVKLKYYPKWR